MGSDRFTVCLTAAVLWLTGAPATAGAQVAESVGTRALGMGGAFVAVASDSSATWWNPAGLAAGPFLDMALARAKVETGEGTAAWRHTTSWFALATPPVGISYYRFRITDIQPSGPTAAGGGDREDRAAGVPVRSLSASHLGVTLVQTLIAGVHAGATLKYVRGTVHAGRSGAGMSTTSDLLDAGEALQDGDADSRFDVDAGLLAVAGPVRLGARIRNALQPAFEGMRLPRQTRVGVAFDPEALTGVPLTVALDADVVTYETASGPRRVVAAGAEQWFLARRLGVRAGGRFNTTGARERSATAGASVAVRSGLYVEGHAVRGGSADERGWGIAARVSF
ncbi:MAG: hypothetical protein A3H29_03225 [Acidobacteria bacterium RIFCSPLOWO2_02_FULL_67_21]|nr:MAG: hypothetical protein A3H29_03225 [Acidobacteria bacterium RIFCSPLOWO2_02_FULL_67_21]